MEMRPNILFVHNYPSKFVRIDLQLLRDHYNVQEWYQKSRVVNLPALVRAVAQSDLIFAWFASWHSFFPVIFAHALGKPSLLVIGGYDTANAPEINYGSQRGGIKKWVARTTMNFATQLIVNSQASLDEAIGNAGVAKDRVSVIYHGLEANENYLPVRKEKLVITVGNVDRSNLTRKGLEPFVRTAGLIPDCEFVMIGAWRDNAIARLRSLASPNLQFTGWVSEDELHDYMARAAVYVQASRHEGFGLAVAEAMLHQCVPVVTRAGSLPEVVGDAGVYLASVDPHEIANGINRALTMTETLGPRARGGILTQFPLGKRGQLLIQMVDAMLKSNG